MGLGGWQKPSQFKTLWAMVKDMTEIFFQGRLLGGAGGER